MRSPLVHAGALAAALALTPAPAGPAHAEVTSGSAGCTTEGARGRMAWTNYHGPGATVGLTFTLTDTRDDRKSVRVRLLSKDTFGRIHQWGWRTNARGKGTTETWRTSASHPNGLFDIAVEVARFDGNGVHRNSCTTW
ncbi:hypothetical protein [Streptomyces filamentosus]|uniref:hypothetical protein n=1 Tax=Streptomyces filamentosus TaxID=67294 RepID=UPI0033C64B18